MSTHARRIVAALAISTSALAPLVGIAPAHASGPLEDEQNWSCVDYGNRVCGPGNPEGKPAACYDTGGVIVELWPCTPVPPGVFATR